MSELDGEELPLALLFRRVKMFHSRLDEMDLTNDEAEASLKAAIKDLMQCMHTADRLALFSSNETKDDVATADLKYLLLPFYLAEVLQRMPGEDRKGPLQMAQRNLQLYLDRCDGMELLGEVAREKYRRGEQGLEAVDPQSKRAEKVARFKRDKDLRARLEEMHRKLSGRDDEDDGGDEDDERELWSMEIERAALQAQDQLGHIAEELELLKYRRTLSPSELAAVPQRQETPELQALKDSIMSAAANLQQDRQRFKDGVFKPSHILPTMSIEEFGRLEHEEMMRRQEEGAIAQEAAMRAAAEREGGDSEEEDDAEKKKQRAWDDFRDANPRGHGNRKNMG